MLMHCVFLKVLPTHDTADTEEVLRALGQLKDEVDGIVSYEWGPNRDFEDKTAEHTYGFVIKFRDREANLAYAQHPKHLELGSRLVAMCDGGADGIAVYDIECAPA